MTDMVKFKLTSEAALATEAARRTLKQGTLTEIKSLARTHTALAIKTLVNILRDKELPPMSRAAAANVILGLGWGKPMQSIAREAGKPIEFIHRIEQVVVDPGDNAMMEVEIEESVQRTHQRFR